MYQIMILQFLEQLSALYTFSYGDCSGSSIGLSFSDDTFCYSQLYILIGSKLCTLTDFNHFMTNWGHLNLPNIFHYNLVKLSCLQLLGYCTPATELLCVCRQSHSRLWSGSSRLDQDTICSWLFSLHLSKLWESLEGLWWK